MSDKSKIEWCDATWNPVTGCTKVSEGCRNCYALTFAERWRGTPGHYFENGFDITLRPDKLDQPYRWKRPRKVFVNSMSDLFHDDIPDDFIWNVFQVMARCPQHTFQVLTKRPERMMQMFKNRYWRDFGDIRALVIEGWHTETDMPFLPNVWLGTSVENQQVADERIPLLIQTPAAVRFLSCEPLLGRVDLSGWQFTDEQGEPIKPPIDWVIAGGESGPKARPVHPEWIRELRDCCQASGTSFFFKQWGEWLDFQEATCPDRVPHSALKRDIHTFEDGTEMIRVGKHNAGRLLDGREHNAFP